MRYAKRSEAPLSNSARHPQQFQPQRSAKRSVVDLSLGNPLTFHSFFVCFRLIALCKEERTYQFQITPPFHVILCPWALQSAPVSEQPVFSRASELLIHRYNLSMVIKMLDVYVMVGGFVLLQKKV